MPVTMDKRYLAELLQKHSRGETTPEEELILNNYDRLFDSEPDGLQVYDDASKEALKAGIYDGISKKIAEAEYSHKRGSIIRPFMIKMAVAASLLVICITAIAYFTHVPAKTNAPVAVVKKENHLVYLPDGSKVIVSRGSTFYQSPSFGSASREVYLEGQAYFDIAHDAARPFIVHTGKLSTTVLGTAFNIKALPGEEEITVTVTRGKVKISDEKKTLALVTPGRQVIYSKKAGSSIQQAADINSTPDWKKQDLLVNNITVAEAAALLEDRFNVSILIEDSLISQDRFTTVFLKTESLDQILKSICAFNDATYQYDKENAAVIISKNDYP